MEEVASTWCTAAPVEVSVVPPTPPTAPTEVPLIPTTTGDLSRASGKHHTTSDLSIAKVRCVFVDVALEKFNPVMFRLLFILVMLRRLPNILSSISFIEFKL